MDAVTTTQSDPSTTTEHDEPEEPTSQPDQTGPSETVTDGDTPGVGADDAPPQPFKDINRAVWPQFAPALLPWGDGFLQYGYAASGARHWHSQLVIRYLADGLTWSDFEALPVPFSDVLVSDARDDSIRAAASDGQRLLFVVQQDNRILVSITGDLTNWDTIEIVPPPTDGLPHGVRAKTSADGLTIGPDGWLLRTSTRLGVDLRVLAPADIGESAQNIRFDVPESQGLNVEWNTEQQEPGEPYFSRFVTWEELGIDEDTYLHYGIAEYLMSPRTPSWLISGEVWSANWGQEPIRAELPEVRGAVGWQIDGTDAGYVGLPEIGKPGTVVVEHPMFFSSDGLTWAAIDGPEGDRVSLLQLSAVENGIVVAGDVLDSQDPYFPDRYSPVGYGLWLGDATGSDWRSVALPGLPERSWLGLRYGDRGAAGVVGLPEGDWRAQWIVASIDGANWLVMEEPAAGDLWMMAVNGDVMVGVDGQGNSKRFLIP